jgi:prolyl 4-hydroxylase
MPTNTQDKTLDERSLERLRRRIQLACDMAETIEMLRGQGFSEAAIIAGFEAVRPRGNALAKGAMRSPPLIRRAPPNLHKIDNPKFDLYTLDDFLDPKECAQLLALISHHLRPSTLANDYVGDGFRTSQTAFLGNLHSPAAVAVDAKICKTLGIRAEYSEGIQAQRYDVGQQFKPHFDAFEPGSDAYKRLASMRGNRTWTFMVYLNEGMEGGATRFTEIEYAVQPKAGMALFWNNLHDDGSPNLATRHCGEPVTNGHKVIITKWFRVLGEGAVFYEAAGGG